MKNLQTSSDTEWDVFFFSFSLFLRCRGCLTGAGGLRRIAVSAIETTLAGTNVGSLCTGATVGWAGGTRSLSEFGFEGPSHAGWMNEREKHKTPTVLSLIWRTAAYTFVTEQKQNLWRTCRAQNLRGKRSRVHVNWWALKHKGLSTHLPRLFCCQPFK